MSHHTPTSGFQELSVLRNLLWITHARHDTRPTSIAGRIFRLPRLMLELRDPSTKSGPFRPRVLGYRITERDILGRTDINRCCSHLGVGPVRPT